MPILVAVLRHLTTRHRSGLGLSEQCDALVIIVSEETGQASFTLNGNLYRFLEQKCLNCTLIMYMKRDRKIPQPFACDMIIFIVYCLCPQLDHILVRQRHGIPPRFERQEYLRTDLTVPGCLQVRRCLACCFFLSYDHPLWVMVSEIPNVIRIIFCNKK
jgi:hypothetical protein